MLSSTSSSSLLGLKAVSDEVSLCLARIFRSILATTVATKFIFLPSCFVYTTDSPSSSLPKTRGWQECWDNSITSISLFVWHSKTGSEQWVRCLSVFFSQLYHYIEPKAPASSFSVSHNLFSSSSPLSCRGARLINKWTAVVRISNKAFQALFHAPHIQEKLSVHEIKQDLSC